MDLKVEMLLNEKEKERQEAIEYCERIERMAKSQARAWFETYNAMRKNFNLSSDYFEQQGKLF